VPQAAETPSTPHATQRLSPARAAILQAPFRLQHTKVTGKRDEKHNRLCEFGGCNKRAIFGSPADRVMHFCGPHKQEGHVNLE
jgi:hypothetical protein